MQHSRLSCPSLSLGVFSNSYLLGWWCHPTISSSVAHFSCPQSFPASVFSGELALCIRWPKYWSFSFSIIPSKEYSGLISLGLTGLISLQSKGLSKVLSSTTSFIIQLSHQDETTRKTTLYNTNKIKIFMSRAILVYIIYCYLKLYYKFTFFPLY